MRSERRKKLIILIMLLIGVCSISVGFAAYSTSLKIESGLAIAPDESAFSIQFSSSSSSLETDPVSPSSKSEGLEATDAIINNSTKPTIGGYRATFTKTQQYVTYSFYVRNTGKYTAYLNSIGFSGDKNCIAKLGTTESSVSENCDDVSVRTTVKVGGITTTETMLDITGETLTPNQSKLVEVTFEYFGGGKFIDGDFSIEFPEISLYYATTGGINGSFGDDSGLVTLTSNTDTLVLSDVTSKQLDNYRIYGSNEGVGTKNLLDISKITTGTGNESGLYIINNGDGFLTTVPQYFDTHVGKTLKELAPSLKVGDVVTLSGKTDSFDAEYNHQYMELFYLIKAKLYWRFGTSQTITQDMLDSKVKVYTSRSEEGVLSAANFWNLQIEYGTVATDYQPYTPQERYVIPVTVRGKNLLDMYNREKFEGSMPYENTSKRSFDFNKYYIGLSPNNFWAPHYMISASLENNIWYVHPRLVGYGVNFPLKVKANTKYTLSGNMGSHVWYGFYDSASNYINCGDAKGTVTMPSFTDVATVVLRPSLTDVPVEYSYIQVEEGSTATPYEPYVTPTNFDIVLSKPLMAGEYIDFKEQKVVRHNGTKEDISLPAITTFSVPTTIIELGTRAKSSMIEISYFK